MAFNLRDEIACCRKREGDRTDEKPASDCYRLRSLIARSRSCILTNDTLEEDWLKSQGCSSVLGLWSQIHALFPQSFTYLM